MRQATVVLGSRGRLLSTHSRDAAGRPTEVVLDLRLSVHFCASVTSLANIVNTKAAAMPVGNCLLYHMMFWNTDLYWQWS